MKAIARALAAVAAATPAFAAAGTETGAGGGILLYLFLGFGAIIVVSQVIPSLILFGTMVKEVIALAREKARGEGS